MAVLIDQYAGAQISDKMYPHWRGGYYYAVRSKGDPAAPLGLLYASRWSSPEKAANFAAIYASALSKRYLHVHDVLEAGKEPPVPTEALDHLMGKRAWLTEDGPVVIDVQGDTVVITESLDQTTTDSLEQEVSARQPNSVWPCGTGSPTRSGGAEHRYLMLEDGKHCGPSGRPTGSETRSHTAILPACIITTLSDDIRNPEETFATSGNRDHWRQRAVFDARPH